MLLNRLFESTDDGTRRGYTLEVRVSNDGAIKLYEASGFVRAAFAAVTTRQPRGRVVMWRDPEADSGVPPVVEFRRRCGSSSADAAGRPTIAWGDSAHAWVGGGGGSLRPATAVRRGGSRRASGLALAATDARHAWL